MSASYFFNIKLDKDNFGNERRYFVKPKPVGNINRFKEVINALNVNNETKPESDNNNPLQTYIKELAEKEKGEINKSFILYVREKSGFANLFKWVGYLNGCFDVVAIDDGTNCDFKGKPSYHYCSENNCLVIFVYDDDAKDQTSENIATLESFLQQEKVNSSKASVLFSRPLIKELDCLKVLTVVLKEDKVYSDMFELNFFKYEDSTALFDVIFDFGSESSQLKQYIRLYGKDTEEDDVGLVEKLCSPEFYNCDSKAAYWQKNGDEYASKLFTNSPISSQQLNNNEVCAAQDSVVLPLLSQENEKSFKEHMLLPNLKLAMLDRKLLSTMPSLTLDDGNQVGFQRIFDNVLSDLYDVFMRLILNEASTEFYGNKINKRLFSITLMMPNVYSQANLKYIMDRVNKACNVLKSQYGIVGIEVKSISESDAAFVGYMAHKRFTKKSFKKNDSFLLIDSGKGTTDFSVIRYQDKNKSLESVFRGGSAGAGQFLSLGVLEGLSELCDFDIVDIINKEADVSKQYKFMTIVDNIKKRTYVPDKVLNSQSFDASITITIDTLIELFDCFYITNENDTVDTLNSLDDLLETLAFLMQPLTKHEITKTKQKQAGNIMKEYAKVIVNETLDDIDFSEENNFTEVFLSGRAFFLDYYNEEMVKELLSRGMIEKRSQIVFFPEKAKDICLKAPLATESGLNTTENIVGRLIFRERNNRYRRRQNKWVKKAHNFMKRFVDTDKDITIDDKLFGVGHEILATQYATNLLYIGNRGYQKENGEIENADNHDIVINFDGDSFSFRTQDRCQKIRLDEGAEGNEIKRDFVIASLFPFNLFNAGQKGSEVIRTIKNIRNDVTERLGEQPIQEPQKQNDVKKETVKEEPDVEYTDITEPELEKTGNNNIEHVYDIDNSPFFK